MLLARTLLVLALATPVLSAGVIVVDAAGGGDFTTLSAAVAAAVNGDTILVKEGLYAEPGLVDIDGKSLSVIGEPPASSGLGVRVGPGIVVHNLPPGGSVVLQNLYVQGSQGTASVDPFPALTLANNSAHVRVQGCELVGGNGANNAHPAGAEGVLVSNSLSSAIVGCSVAGGDGQFSPNLGVTAGDGGSGLVFGGGNLLVSASHVGGGTGGSNNIGGWPDGGDGGAGIVHQAGVQFVVGGAIHGGSGGIAHNGGDGGDGLVLFASGSAQLMAGAFLGGGEAGWGDDKDGVDGVAVDDPLGLVTDHGGTPHGFDVISPVREGQLGALDLQGDPGDTTLLFISSALYQFPLPGHQGVLMIAPIGMLGPITIALPGDGLLPFTTPTLPAALDVLHVHLQPAYAGVDGVILGTGRVLTILDSSL